MGSKGAPAAYDVPVAHLSSYARATVYGATAILLMIVGFNVDAQARAGTALVKGPVTFE
jgi:hypothetical protein